MKIIQIISERINEELEDSKYYIEMAFKYKDEYPDYSNLCFQLSGTEREHAELLHTQATKIIDKYVSTGAEVPQFMKDIWDEKHQKYIECYAKVKVMADMYKK